MRRAKPVLALLALLAFAFAASACALYFEEEPPGPPSGIPPDAGYVPPPPPPPPGVTTDIPIPSSLRDETLFLDVVWIYDTKPMVHAVHPIDPDTVIASVSDPDAVMLAATLYTNDGQIVDAALFRERCPDETYLPTQSRLLEVPFDHDSIQSAVDEASAGDMVYVHAGTYYEHIRLRPGVHLIGAGAHRTILEGEGEGENLIDFTGAAGAVVRGFTLRNVGPRADGCDAAVDALDCTGNWFTAAVYGDGHDPVSQLQSCVSSIVLMHNIIEDSDIGVLLYFYASAAVRNNLFLSNGTGLIGNYLNERALVMGNTFDVAEHRFLAADISSPLDASNNILSNAVLATETEGYEPDVTANCTLLHGVDDGGRLVPVDVNGNQYLDPGFRDVPAGDYRLSGTAESLDLGCYQDEPVATFSPSPGAYGGPLGDWYQRDIEVDELKRFLD